MRRTVMGHTQASLHKHAKCARHCVQINFPLLYPDVSDTVPVGVSIKILMLPVISLSLAVAGYRIDLTRLLSSKIPSATLWNNNLVDFSLAEQSLPLSSTRTFFSFYSDPCNLSFFFLFFNRQLRVHFSSTIFHLFFSALSYHILRIRVIYSLCTSHTYNAYLVINGKYSEFSTLAKFLCVW